MLATLVRRAASLPGFSPLLPGAGASLGVVLLLGSCVPDGPGADTRSAVLAMDREAVFTVGRSDGNGPDVFGRVRDVAFARDGSLLVLDDLARHVVVFGRSGRMLGVLGRPGEGPGEFQLPLAVASTSGGYVVVYDSGAGAVHVFGPGGGFLHRVSLPRALGVDQESVHGLGADTLVFLGGESLFEEPDSLPLYRVSLEEGAEPVAVARLPNPQAAVQVAGVSRTATGGFHMTRRLRASYGPAAHLAPLPGGRAALAAGTAYRVIIISPDGAVEEVRSRPVRPRAVTDDDRRLERERRSDAMRRAFGSGAGSFAPSAMNDEDIESAVETMIIPDTLPVVRGLRSTPDGTLFVLRTAERTPDPGPVDVFRPDGAFRGTIQDMAFPDALGPRGLAAWILRDSLDVHRVEVARLVLRRD